MNMPATIIYNPNARTGIKNGDADTNDVINNFQNALREAGYTPRYIPTKREEDLDVILSDTEGLVIAAGGDGTARAVLTRLINRDNVHFTPLPMGTANNICRNLGIEGEPVDILRRLHSPRSCKFDMGHFQAGWGEDYFVEGAGIGFFAEVLAFYDPEKGKSILRSLESVLKIVDKGYLRETVIELPDRTIDDAFLLVEILNTNSVGPRLNFAPDADPTDGLLHVVCIRENQGEGFWQYLRGLAVGDLYKLDSVEVYKVPQVNIHWRGFPVHIDAKVHPPGIDFHREDAATSRNVQGETTRPYPYGTDSTTMHFRILPQSFSVWLPAPENPELVL